MMRVPQRELDEAIRSIRSRPQYFEPAYMLEEYRQVGIETIPDPTSTEVVLLITQALANRRPFSVIRIGDGEASLLSSGDYPATPALNRSVAEDSVAMQEDSFRISPLWMITLRDLMMAAVCQADVVGVIGLRRLRIPDIEEVVEKPDTGFRIWRCSTCRSVRRLTSRRATRRTSCCPSMPACRRI